MTYYNMSKKPTGPMHIIKKVIVAILVVPISICYARMLLSAIQIYIIPTNKSLNNYCSISTSVFEAKYPYVVFPDKEFACSAKNIEYSQKKSIPPLFTYNTMAYVFLKCEYDKDQYNAEIERLQGLCTDFDNETFYLPACVMYGNYPHHFTEYALLDEDKQTIYYISFQDSFLAKRYIPETLLPKDRWMFKGNAEDSDERAYG